MEKLVPDRYDDVRRAWIARHAGIFTIQKRRAEVLSRQIRDRTRHAAGARPNPYDDNVIHPLTTRRPTTPEALLELAIVLLLVVFAPIGWLLGQLLHRWIRTFIPDRLRAYPIPALLWTSVAIGLITVLPYDAGDNLETALIAPWIVAQIPATFFAAGIYGILNGWLAVDGSADWWPIAPPPTPVDLDIPLGPDDLTGPGVFTQLELTSGDRTPTRRTSRPAASAKPILAALLLAAIGITWTITMTVTGTTHIIGELASRYFGM